MANTIQLKLLDNKTIVAEVDGRNYAYEGGYRIIAGESGDTYFEIVSIPKEYEDYTIHIDMTNAQGYPVPQGSINLTGNRQFNLPDEMAVEGYGSITIKAIQGNVVAVWFPIKVKVWNNDWKPSRYAPALITIGETKTIDSDLPANVKNIGSDKYVVLEFEIPKGKSAYDLAVDNGFKGTEQQWLESLKGDPGIGNATLSNIDGDSTENGFTQQAVKGIAQSKNFYNLGVYDSYVTSGNGAGKITRQTKYVILDGSKDEQWVFPGTQNPGFRFTCNNSLNLFNNKYGTDSASTAYPYLTNNYGYTAVSFNAGVAGNNHYAFAFSATGYLSIYDDRFTTVNAFKAELAKNPLIIQIKTNTSYNEDVVENQPIHTLNQNGETWLQEEYNKGLNLAHTLKADYSWSGNGVTIMAVAKVEAGKSYKISFTGSKGGSTTGNGGFLIVDSVTPNPTYANWATAFSAAFYRNEAAGAINVNISRTVSNGYIVILCGSVGYSVSYTINNVLISDSLAAYQPYYGGIVRKREVPLFITATNENPAIIIGGDWEDKGTVTTSENIVLHVYEGI